MTSLMETALGPDGAAYIANCLRQGTGLSRKLLELPLMSGNVFAPLLKQLSRDRATSFNVGGMMARQTCCLWLADHLRHLWETAGSGTFVLQDIWAKPSDLSIRRSRCKSFSDASSVYYFLERGEMSVAAVEVALSAITSFLVIGIFTGCQIRERQLPLDRKVSPAVIEELAANTREIFVSAYDQEGLVVWQNPEVAAAVNRPAVAQIQPA